MSLPADPKTPWPPSEPAADFASWSAWYSGELSALESDSAPPSAWQRFRSFWTRQKQTESKSTSGPHPLHLPLASDIAQTSSDLLFGEECDFAMPEVAKYRKTQARLEEIIDQSGLHNSLLEAAETCAAMGGVYLVATWDNELPYPFLVSRQADAAVPSWHFGNLSAVTFWRELERDGQKVYRHLERHEEGTILHGLYLGTPSELGSAIPLTTRPETADLQPMVTLPQGMTTDVWYVPNALPNRKLRTSPVGRPDVAGCEGALDALDETYSSLMRDIRLGKSRIIVPSGSLQAATKYGGRGAGKTFDTEADIFTELDGLMPENGRNITASQFQIRTDEHLRTAADLMEKVASAAGYSPQTFGLRIEGSAESGTALRLREGKTYRTLKRKRRYWRPRVQEATRALLVIERELRGNRTVTVETPHLSWPAETASPGEMARTLLDLRNAESASIETRVRMLDPSMGDDEVAAEVERIRAESGLFAAPPPQLP